MPKKKASTDKPARPTKNHKKIIAVQHREIKHTGRKYDNAFLELKVWLPLWELPLWTMSSDTQNMPPVIKRFLQQLIGESADD